LGTGALEEDALSLRALDDLGQLGERRRLVPDLHLAHLDQALDELAQAVFFDVDAGVGEAHLHGRVSWEFGAKVSGAKVRGGSITFLRHPLPLGYDRRAWIAISSSAAAPSTTALERPEWPATWRFAADASQRSA